MELTSEYIWCVICDSLWVTDADMHFTYGQKAVSV